MQILHSILRNTKNEDHTEKYSLEMLELAEKINSHFWQCSAHLRLGQTYKYKGNHQQALYHLLEAFKHSNYPPFTNNGFVNSELGSLYGYLGKHHESVSHFQKAINYHLLSKSKDDSTYLSLAFNNLAEEYIRTDQLDSALGYYLKAFDIAKLFKSPYYLAIIKGNLGIVNAKLGEYELAEEQIMGANRTLTELDDLASVSSYLTYLADVYIQRGDLSKAEVHLSESLRIAQSRGLKNQIRDTYLKLYDFKKAEKNYSEALNFYESYVLYRDSIINMESVKKIANLQTQFEVGQKQAEVDLLTSEKKIQQLMLFAAIVFALVFIILASIIYKYYRDKNKVAKVLELQKHELERLNTTKDKFFSIISHDLRGPVSSFFGISRMIKFLVKAKETDQLLEIADDIDQSVEHLSNLLDNLLNWAMQQHGHVPNVPERLEFKYLAMDLAATFKIMADSKKIKLNVEVEDTVQLWADRNTTMTIFRNLINNALKFTPEGGTVTLFASEKDGRVTAGVRDTGVGIPKEKLESLFTLGDKKSTYGTSGEKGLGLGLQLVYEFIELNNGAIKVESVPEVGTTFEVRLPAFSSSVVLIEGK